MKKKKQDKKINTLVKKRTIREKHNLTKLSVASERPQTLPPSQAFPRTAKIAVQKRAGKRQTTPFKRKTLHEAKREKQRRSDTNYEIQKKRLPQHYSGATTLQPITKVHWRRASSRQKNAGTILATPLRARPVLH